MMEVCRRNKLLVIAGVACLMGIFLLQLILIARANTITWDENDHIYSGYMQWTHGDFGLNPEHPPLVKTVAALPLLDMHLKLPPMLDRPYRLQAVRGGTKFIFGNNADRIVFRARMAAASFALLLVLLVFLATQEMFGTGASFVALGLIVFDPNLLANGALVTMDTAQACFLLASIYAFYRYIKLPSLPRVVVTGVAVGLALATDHSAILIFPMLLALAILEILWKGAPPSHTTETAPLLSRMKIARRLAGALALIVVVATAVLWATYWFRYAAREHGMSLHPSFAAQIQKVPSPLDRHIIGLMATLHILPQSYLYGLAHVLFSAGIFHSFLLGKIYPHAVWFYFPVAMAIKSTLTFIILLAITLWAVATKRIGKRREMLYLFIPALLFLAVIMADAGNIGVRYVLTDYVLLSVAIGGTAWKLMQGSRRWLYAVLALLVFQAISVARICPNYLEYANEAAGGPSHLHLYLSDSNVDWAQQLKPVKRYLDQNHVSQCWFVYFGYGVVDYQYYGIPCKPLPTVDSLWLGGAADAPASINGPVLISAGDLSGFEFGPSPLNPYEQFKHLKADAAIDDSVFVYNGHFDIPLAASIADAQQAELLSGKAELASALAKAQQAVALAPNSVRANVALGDVLKLQGHPRKARPYYLHALALAKSVDPRFQKDWLPQLEQDLGGK